MPIFTCPVCEMPHDRAKVVAVAAHGWRHEGREHVLREAFGRPLVYIDWDDASDRPSPYMIVLNRLDKCCGGMPADFAETLDAAKERALVMLAAHCRDLGLGLDLSNLLQIPPHPANAALKREGA